MIQKKKPQETLNGIHNEFVVIPIDNANGNVAFICQRKS